MKGTAGWNRAGGAVDCPYLMPRYSDTPETPGAACPTYVPLVVFTAAPIDARLSRVGRAVARDGSSNEAAADTVNFMMTEGQHKNCGQDGWRGSQMEKKERATRLRRASSAQETVSNAVAIHDGF